MNGIKIFTGLLIFLLSAPTLSENTLRITVKTDEKTSFGIGYSVNGKLAGALGRVYTGIGPKNQKYIFGYRKASFNGSNVSCGTLTLTQDSIVTLIVKNNKCLSVIN